MSESKKFKWGEFLKGCLNNICRINPVKLLYGKLLLGGVGNNYLFRGIVHNAMDSVERGVSNQWNKRKKK